MPTRLTLIAALTIVTARGWAQPPGVRSPASESPPPRPAAPRRETPRADEALEPGDTILTREQIAARIEPVLRQPPVSGLLVYGVDPKSQAHRGQVRVGDILTGYDGQQLTSTRDLAKLVLPVLREKRKTVALFHREGAEREVDLGPNAIGVRLIPVVEGSPRVLWRPPTDYSPDLAPLEARMEPAVRYAMLSRGDKVVGWSRSFLKRTPEGMVYRVQTRIQSELPSAAKDAAKVGIDTRSDVVISFAADRHLSPTAMQIRFNDKVILDIHREKSRFVGLRQGVPASDQAPADTVSSHLAPLVALTMPQEAGACLRCSYLDAGSISTAPFADIVCLGKQEFAPAVDPNTGEARGQRMTAWRYEMSVFGEPVADFVVDGERNLRQINESSGLRSMLGVTERQLLKRFPNFKKDFEPIEQLPRAGVTPVAQ
jgi:hypothetical protein